VFHEASYETVVDESLSGTKPQNMATFRENASSSKGHQNEKSPNSRRTDKGFQNQSFLNKTKKESDAFYSPENSSSNESLDEK